MKRLTKTLFVFGFTCAISATPLFAQIFTFDENGNSTGAGISPGVLQAGPSGGLPSGIPVLVYQLAMPVVSGDVVLVEAGQPPTAFSDVVRFWNVTTGANVSQIIFYSDIETTEPEPVNLADTGLPSLLTSPVSPVYINEVGPEGNNGAVWTPPAGAPGSSLAGVVVQYNIISDVPEPGSLALLAGGLGILLGVDRFRQKGFSLKAS